jgi:hypothetical protein
MKALILLAGFMFGIISTTTAQEGVTFAAQEACSCLKALDPEQIPSNELNLKIIGCMSRPIDVIAEKLEKEKLWADSSAFYYLGLIGDKVKTFCPDEIKRLTEYKKKEVEIDPTLLAIDSEAELVPAFSKAVCNCLGVINDVEECMKKVAKANMDEISNRMENVLTGMISIMTDVMFDLADHCDAAANNENISALKRIPAITDGCKEAVLGDYLTADVFGETRAIFTSKKLQEFSDGKLTAEYALKWTGCNLFIKCTKSNSGLVKKGKEYTMEIKRASEEGFIAYLLDGPIKILVTYKKVN